jgi:hypothetical protein
MKLFCTSFVVLVTLIVMGLEAQTTSPPRFEDPEGITADPTGLRRDTSARFPRYPWDLVTRKTTGAPVVAFVIDTMGRVELKTATFLNAPQAVFAKAVCDGLPKLRFQPFLVADQKWRVLLVEMYGFTTWPDSDSAARRAAATLASRSQEEFSTKPIRKVIEQLEKLPHCEAHQ